MPETFDALAVFAVALLPGALYIWSFERLVGRWGIGLSDRVLRFVGASAVFHAAAAPITYWLWNNYLSSGQLRMGRPLSWLLWLAPVLYVGIPILLGHVVGLGTRNGSTWVRPFIGANPVPRGWDFLFGDQPAGWVRLKLKAGGWIGGKFDERSYAARYPEPPDLYLSQVIETDPDTGEFETDRRGQAVTRESGILIRWDEVEHLEFFEE